MNHLLSAPPVIPVTYITTAAAMNACVAQLAQAPSFAFDLEFDRDFYTYGFNLCLMQVASPSQCYLIDPLGELDIRLIFPLLESKVIPKVVHCSHEDLRLLHSLQCYPQNLTDTELYAKLLNYGQPSLSAMIQQLFGIELDKKMQKINWGLRPLGPEQLEYAANDVLYLLAMKTELERQAAAKNILPFLQEENELLATTIHNSGPKENFLKKSDLQYLSPYRQYILNGIFRYRDNLAREQNKPAHYIMNEDTLRALARGDISRQEWSLLKGGDSILKSLSGQQNLYDTIDRLHEEAVNKKLSRKRSADALPEERFRVEKARREHIHVFAPIQNHIAACYGEHAMRFIFNTKMVNALIQGQAKIGDMKTRYRRELVRNAANELHLDLSPYE